MGIVSIVGSDFDAFHALMNAYYREGEDADTPQEQVDEFIRFLGDKVESREIEGCFLKEYDEYIGFALFAIDTDGFAFSEKPGYGTVLEIGIIPPYRSAGRGKVLVAFIEDWFVANGVDKAYVSAYGPAHEFWEQCGYKDNGETASNDLPIMVKVLREL